MSQSEEDSEGSQDDAAGTYFVTTTLTAQFNKMETVKRTEKNGETVSLKMWQNYNREDPESQKVYLFIEGTANNIKKVDEIKNTNNSKEPDNKMYRYYLVGSLVMGAGIDF